MDSQKQFMELLGDIVEIAKVNNNVLSVEEINEYFEDMNLNSEQMNAVYDYLHKGHVNIKGYVPGNPPEVVQNEKATIPQETLTDSDLTRNSSRMSSYRKTVRSMTGIDDNILEEICIKLIHGQADEKDKQLIIEKHLSVAMNMATKYANRGISSEELTQEGNLYLVLAVNEINNDAVLSGVGNEVAVKECEKYIRERVKSSIISYIDNENASESELSAALGKASLLHEATKQLATELGRVASIEELSAYTHIPEDEIRDIVSFAGETINIGDGKDK